MCTREDLAAAISDLASRCAQPLVCDDPIELLELIGAAEGLKSALCALQARASVAVDEQVPGATSTQIALARRVSPHKGRLLLGLARALCTDYPQTLARLADGSIEEEKAAAVVRETATLRAHDRAGVDDAICGRPGSLSGVGIRELTDRARALTFELDPGSAVERVRRAEDDRHVSFRATADGMCRVTARLPLAQGAAVFKSLASAAATLQADGDLRTAGRAMADVYVERVTGASGGVPVCINITISDTSLAGGAEAAWIEGAPVPAEVARLLAAGAITDRAATWFRRLYSDNGRLVAMTSKKRIFSGELADFLRIRDRHCRTPYCNAPIKHLDHVVPHAAGGPTSADNGQGLCEACNQEKGSAAHPPTAPPLDISTRLKLEWKPAA